MLIVEHLNEEENHCESKYSLSVVFGILGQMHDLFLIYYK